MNTNVVELPFSQRPPKVLTRDLSDRLEKVNQAARALRALDCHVIGQDLRLGSRQRPMLRIEPPDARLRAVCNGSINRRGNDGRNVTQVYFRGVELGWEQAA